MTILITILVIVAWFAWSFWTVLKKLGTIVGAGSTKETWLDYVALAPVLGSLFVIDWFRKLADKHCK